MKNKLNLPIRFFHAEIEYSSLTKGSYIPPHTDTWDKRLSFVLYFPDNKTTLNEDQKKRLGTAFWGATAGNSTWSFFDCVLLSDDESDRFAGDYEVKYRSSYEANKLVGFVKSDKSWHSVDEISVHVDRRAIVINIYDS